MNEYSVPTTPLRVELWLTDGRTIEGDIFLPAQSPYRDGPMLPSEWASVAPAFIPVRPAVGSEVMLINRSHVVTIALPPGRPAVDPIELIDIPRQHVILETAGGWTFDGRLSIAMPRHQQRVVDWLNGPETHVTLDVGGRAHLVQKAHILRIVELGEA